MGFLNIVASFILIYMFYKMFQAIVTPFVIVFLKIVYKILGKSKEFDVMYAKHKEKYTANVKNRSTKNNQILVNPGSGLPMISGTNIDVCGNTFGSSGR